MYNENSRGPRTDPCGTPYFTVDNCNASMFKYTKLENKI